MKSSKLLEAYYDIHDDFEVLLRKIHKAGLTTTKLGTKTWIAHDELERLTITEQAKHTEEELFGE